MRCRRDIGRIGLRQDHVERCVADYLVVIVGEGDDAREAEREADVEPCLGSVPIASEEVYIARNLCMGFYERDRIVVGILGALRGTDVEHERFAESVGHFDLLDEGFFLHGPGRGVVTVVIEPALAYRDHLRVAAELEILLRIEHFTAGSEFLVPFAEFLRVMVRSGRVYRVQPDSSPGIGIRMSEFDGRFRGIELSPDDIDPDIRLGGTRKDLGPIGVVGGKIEMCMGVEVAHTTLFSGTGFPASCWRG